MLQTPLAFKFVVVLAMMNFVNFYSPRLNLPLATPVRQQDIRFVNVSSPIREQYSARLQVDNYSFTFTEKMLYVHNIADDGFESYGIPMERNESSISGMERASRMKYSVDTNNLYLIATNYLTALDIDVAKVEKTKRLSVNKYPAFHSNRGWVPNPLLTVEWYDASAIGYKPDRLIEVEISAVSGELLHLTAGNYFKERDQPLFKDMDKLAAISDEEFMKYSTLERSNLLVCFTGLHCSDLRCPGIDESLSIRTNQVLHASGTNSNSYVPASDNSAGKQK
jgi:hypothetical protein